MADRSVVWLFEYASLNGGEQSLLATLEFVRQAGWQVTALAPPLGPLADALTKLGVEVVAVDEEHPPGDRSQDRRRTILRQRLMRLRPSLVHANSLSMARLVGPVARALGLASLGHLRDIVGLSRQAVADVNLVCRLLAVSAATAEFHRNQGIEARRMHVLHNGVDLTQFRIRAPSGWLHAELRLPPTVPLIGCIGQIVLRKGLDVMAEAAGQVTGAAAAAHWVIIGERYSDKDEAREFEVDVRQRFNASAAGRAHFLGVRGDVDRILPELTLLAHAARQEPLGRVLLEAAACGVPCVATDVGGALEIFPASARAARLVPSDNATELAQTISQVMDDAAERARLGAAARRRAEQAFDIRQSAAGLVRHYCSVNAELRDHNFFASH